MGFEGCDIVWKQSKGWDRVYRMPGGIARDGMRFRRFGSKAGDGMAFQRMWFRLEA